MKGALFANLVRRCHLQIWLWPAYIFASFIALAHDSSAQGAYGEDLWLRLLHFNKNESRIVSQEFFLAERGRVDPKAEREATIAALRGADGSEIACEFPARYRWLKADGVVLPDHSLERCKDLHEFLKDFPSERLGVAYASEFLDAPASAFGHVMLVFSRPDQPIDAGVAIHFAAEASASGPVEYVWKGLSGGFDGFFIREAFVRKRFEYNSVEQRALHVYWLAAESSRIEFLQLHLFELRKARYQYFFVQENCAFQISHLLDILLPESLPRISPDKFVLPIDVVRSVREYVEGRDTLLPTVQKFDRLVGEMSNSQRDQLGRLINGREALADKTPDPVKEALVLYYEYQFRRRRVVLADYDQISQLTFEPSANDGFVVDPLKSTPPSRFGVGLYGEGQQRSFLFRYRMVNKDRDDPTPYELGASELSFLAMDLVGGLDAGGVRIERADVVNIRSYPIGNEFLAPAGWAFRIGLDRENTPNDLRVSTAAGISRAWSMQGNEVALVVHAGVEGDREVIRPFLSPELSVAMRASPWMVLRLDSRWKHYANDEYRQIDWTVASRNLPRTGGWQIVARFERRSGPVSAKTMVSLNRYW